MARNSAAATVVVKVPIVPFCIVEDAAPMKTWGVGVRTYNASERNSSAIVSLGVGNIDGKFNESAGEDIPRRGRGRRHCPTQDWTL
jgi:hypothetical protein